MMKGRPGSGADRTAWHLTAAAAGAAFVLFLLGPGAGPFLAFSALALPVVWLPGAVVLDALGARPKRALDDLALALVVGTAAAGGFYWLAGLLARPSLFWTWPLVCAGWGLIRWPALRARLSGLRDGLRGGAVLAPLALTLTCIAPYGFMPMFYSNLSRLPDGGLTFYHLPDLVVHAALSQELAHTVPPRWPFLPGYEVAYHYLMDLLPAAFSLAGLSLGDGCVRFVPTLFMATAVLAVYAAARDWLGSQTGAAFVTLLVVFGEDFSWLPGLVLESEAPWASAFFGAPTTPALYMLNPMLPAVGVVFAAVLCLSHWMRDGSAGFLVLAAALLAGVLPQYKVFSAAQLLAGLALVGVVAWMRRRDARLLKLVLLAGVFLLPSLLLRWDDGTRTRVVVLFQQWPYVLGSVARLGLWEVSWLAPLRELHAGRPSGLGHVQFLGALVLYLLGSLGVRVLALPPVVAALKGDPLRSALAWCVILGPVLTLTVSVVVPGLPPGQQYNNAIWFYVLAKYLMSLFLVEWVGSLLTRRSAAFRRWAWAALFAVALPSSAQYFGYQWVYGRHTILPASLMQVIDALPGAARPGDVVWAREHLTEQVIALSPSHGLSLDAFPYLVLSPEQIAEEARRREGFWEQWRAGVLDTGTLVRWRARYVLVERAFDGAAPAHQPGGRLRRVLENPDFSLYELFPD